MEKKRLINAAEVADQLGVSRAYAYKVIRQLNEMLEANGCFVVPGKVNRLFFEQRYFSIPATAEQEDDNVSE